MTRLAQELAWQQRDTFPDGAWFIDLTLLQAERIPAAVAVAPGLTANTAVAPLVERIAAHLACVRALVVLDNCEHVIEAVVQIAGVLLKRCPGVEQHSGIAAKPLCFDAAMVEIRERIDGARLPR